MRANFKTIIVMMMVVTLGLIAVSSATAATEVQRPFPQGIAANNASTAFAQVMARAGLDGSYAAAIARAAGDSTFASAEYNVVGYGQVTSGSNSAVLTRTGNTVGVSDTPICTEGAKALLVRHRFTGKTVEICVGCGNVRLRNARVMRGVKWKLGTTLKFTKKVVLKRTIVCPSGQRVDVRVPIRVSGIARAKTWGKAYGRVTVKQRQIVDLTIRGQINAKCAPAVPVHPPVVGSPPPVVQQIVICGNGSQQVGNGNSSAIVGDHCNTVGPPPPPPPPVVKSIKIVAMTTLNDIPTGKTSGPFYVTVNASEAGGSLTVDPGIGGVSKCDSTTPTGSATFSSLPAGTSEQCIILYAPNDPGTRPTTMTVTANVSLGNAFDSKSSTFAITYPVRPE